MQNRFCKKKGAGPGLGQPLDATLYCLYDKHYRINILVDITRVLFEAGISCNLPAGNREYLPFVIVRSSVIPPGIGCKFTKTDHITSAFPFKDKLAASFCQ